MTTALEMPGNAAALLIDRHIAETNGNCVALRYGEKRYTYHDVAALMNRAGNMFRRLGVEGGQHVLIAVAPSPAWAASLLGAMKIGAVPVLIPCSEEGEELAAAVATLAPAAVVVDVDRASRLAGLANGAPLVTVGESTDAARSFVALLRESASSLARENVGEAAPAIAVVTDRRLRTATHDQLASEQSGGDLGLGSMDGVDVEAVLRAFARCGEVAIPSAR
jgi:acyl-coenzyme A synthetase/AMP-(fatty) acid ligase